VFVSADPGAHAEHVNNLVELGFDEIYLHHVGQTQDRFLEVFGEKVLPQLDVRPKAA
jgi:alkanesulfonate monooxygenase SsuD/methylene tetrahydromethanopterin reductase-like flavin-dependent oxidoreductase (luciferase family)